MATDDPRAVPMGCDLEPIVVSRCCPTFCVERFDQLRSRNAELGASLDRFMQNNSELTVKVHQLEDEIGKLRFALEFIGGLGDHAKPGEVERLVNAVLREVDCGKD